MLVSCSFAVFLRFISYFISKHIFRVQLYRRGKLHTQERGSFPPHLPTVVAHHEKKWFFPHSFQLTTIGSIGRKVLTLAEMRSVLFLILVGHRSHGFVVHRHHNPASYISATVPVPDNLDVSYRRIPRRRANNPSLSGVSVTEAMESMSSTSGPHLKTWADTFGVTAANPTLEDDAIKVVCYNCLGPMHGEGSKHDYAAVSITKWTRRRDRLLDELRGMSADIYCLQEISAKALKETFIPNLKHVGLECFGFAPSKQADKVKGKYGHKYVGCAIFGRSDKFNIIASKRVHLRDYGPLDVCRSHRFHVDYVAKWNSMVMIMVQLKATNQTVCIANTHIFWNPARADIKATQTYAAL